ncbi:nitronate monooxygenase [Streptomyces sp. PA03-3a]|nr:nitronate monooxygenase [Streptomyces sp. PA03-3a]
MLALGAGTAQFGTRCLAAEEATVHPDYKAALVAAGAEDTRTVGRGLIRAPENDFTARMRRLKDSAAELDVRRKEFQGATPKDAALRGRVREGKVEAGQSAGLVHEVPRPWRSWSASSPSTGPR